MHLFWGRTASQDRHVVDAPLEQQRSRCGRPLSGTSHHRLSVSTIKQLYW